MLMKLSTGCVNRVRCQTRQSLPYVVYAIGPRVCAYLIALISVLVVYAL